jgi:hypothetical protein
VWLLAYADDEHAFPEDLWVPWLDAWSERFGLPQLDRTFDLRTGGPFPSTLRAIHFASP